MRITPPRKITRLCTEQARITPTRNAWMGEIDVRRCIHLEGRASDVGAMTRLLAATTRRAIPTTTKIISKKIVPEIMSLSVRPKNSKARILTAR
jgi:hypothetical protein